MIKVAVVGGCSFIAQKFILNCRHTFEYKIFSRKLVGYKNEYLKNDFFDIKVEDLIGFDVIINFAAIVHQPGLNNETLYRKVNFELPISLANKAKKAKVSQFVQLSTIAVYGKLKNINALSVPAPVNFYGKYKLLADNALMDMQNSNFNISMVRPSMVYGGGRSPGNMLSLINLVKKRLPLPFKNISNSRTFLNINNLTSVLEKIILLRKKGIVLLADEESYSTSEIITKINATIELKDKQFKLEVMWLLLKKLKPDLYLKLACDLYVNNTYSFEELGIKKIYNLEDGLKEMI